MSFGTNLKKIRQDNDLTQDELAKKINTSRSNIANYENDKNMPSIDILEKLSEVFNCSIDYLLGKSDIKNPDLKDKLFLIPVVGKVSAGKPILAEENIEGYLPIDPLMYHLTSANGFFFLQIQGESMNKLIKNGSYALIKKQEYAENGDVIVAIVNGDDEATVKRYKQLNEQFIMLEPVSEDSTFQPITIDLKTTTFNIIGKVVGDFKRWS